MHKKTEIEKTFRLSLIILFLSEFISMLGPFIDGIVTGLLLGPDQVRVFGIINPILLIYYLIGHIFAVGSTTVCTRLIGKGQFEEARNIFSTSFLWTLILSFISIAGMLLFSDLVVSFLGATEQQGALFSEARNYYIGITAGLPASNLMVFLIAHLQVDNDRTRILAATLILTAVDAAGDLLTCAILNTGMLGMGLSTALANYAALCVLMLHFRNKEALFKPRFHHGAIFSIPRDVLTNGTPACVSLIGASFMFIVLNRIILSYEGVEIILLAFTAQRIVFQIISAVFKSMGRNVMTMGAFFYGERSEEDLGVLFRLMIKYTILVAVVIIPVLLLISNPLAVVLTGESIYAIPQAAKAIRILSASLMFMIFNVGYECLFRGFGRLKISLAMTVLRDFLLPTGIALMLSYFIKGAASLWALCISQAVFSIVLLIAITLSHIIRRNSFIADVFFLPDNFTASKERCLHSMVFTLEDCVETSRLVGRLCIDNGLSKSISFKASLCVEELCRNILEHGFKDHEMNAISVRCLIDEEAKVRLSIRDDCIPFNPVEWYKLHHDNEDRTANIGIRMIAAISEEFRYINALNMNNLYITV